MSSPKYNKAKGAAFEIDVMKWFRGLGVLAERLRLAGKDDEGDLVVVVLGGPRLRAMVKGERIMAVPEGIITTSDILVPEETVVEETVTEELTAEEELDQA